MSSQNRFLQVINPLLLIFLTRDRSEKKINSKADDQFLTFPLKKNTDFLWELLTKTALVKNHSIFRSVWTMLFYSFIKKLYVFFLSVSGGKWFTATPHWFSLWFVALSFSSFTLPKTRVPPLLLHHCRAKSFYNCHPN